ncbi:hypothetical protein BS50DRAFT_638035 [Corynespora cassiicola Philippines]|uniref:O-methyltransferase n=1 Tax=Corynespora cassiicola Philippines TaxID=1448308 RepID=A0A2T2NAH3_CORCC|nr:hypothetical protein BS50DRAFT_638035 [Corynespora cassiicola Philippines]
MLSPYPFEDALAQAQRAGDEIKGYLEATRGFHHGLNNDPFHPQSPIETPLAIQAPRRRLAEAAATLLQLAIDPKEYLEQISANNHHLVCLRWLVNLEIVDRIPTQGSISYKDLAVECNVPERQLRSVARMAAAHGFLHESSPLNISHSRSSALVATDPEFLNWARFLTNYSIPSAFRFPEATQRWGLTEKKNETAFNIAMNVEQPFFDHLKQNREMNTMFSSYMRNVASSEATSLKHLVNGFDWGSLPSGATVVDVGGSTGHASAVLAEKFPNLFFIVQDLPETLENLDHVTSSKPDLTGRLQFMPHDFFTPQPVTHADIYLLRMIIHDWPDETAVKILSHIRDALKKTSSRIIIMDTVLPQPGAMSLLQERQLRVRDLTMMQVFNAKEREYESWSDLLAKAGLVIKDLQQPEGSNMAVLEVAISQDRAGAPGQPIIPIGTSQNRSSLLNNDAHSNRNSNVASSHIANENFAAPITGTPTNISRSSSAAANIPPPNPSLCTQKGQLPVLIIGAGISGLCLAQYLERRAIPFVVFDRDISEQSRPQGYRLKLESDAADALRETLSPEMYLKFEASCAISAVGETDYDPISGACIRSRAGGGLAGGKGLRASYTVDRSVFRKMLMTGIHHKILFDKELDRFHIEQDQETRYIRADFKDGSTVFGRFLVGADGTRSAVRKQFLPDHRFVDTGAICIYGKTIMTSELLQRFPAKGLRWMTACADRAPLIQSILIGESPLTLLSEPIRFSEESRKQASVALPDDYVYWVLIGRKELFAESESDNSFKAETAPEAAKLSASTSLLMTSEWGPAIRSLLELQDVSQASTMRVLSAPPNIAEWQTSPHVTLVGDSIHAMSPCGGVGANIALRDAAQLGKVITGTGKGQDFVDGLSRFEADMRKRALAGIMRSFAGSKKMFDQLPFEKLSSVQT